MQAEGEAVAAVSAGQPPLQDEDSESDSDEEFFEANEEIEGEEPETTESQVEQLSPASATGDPAVPNTVTGSTK